MKFTRKKSVGSAFPFAKLKPHLTSMMGFMDYSTDDVTKPVRSPFRPSAMLWGEKSEETKEREKLRVPRAAGLPETHRGGRRMDPSLGGHSGCTPVPPEHKRSFPDHPHFPQTCCVLS
ncbi:hypothetical protein SKAU_G00204470 [Synaphobranchus kaupii]|uniref:Uncharacterized protein n=1 Tax=Synaphobranchus kaupii TaxID=118154 RepID=A0A9Q1IYJ0_SYNKA|nr:hypothetical protein SKAU_G00204470 [Synaphobranchus kaupii]